MNDKERQELFNKWYKARDEQKLRVNYPLNENSLVFDIGAYIGNWSADIYNLYKCKIWCFEPIKDNFKKLEKRFSYNDNFRLLNYAISSEDGNRLITIDKDSSGFYNQNNITEPVEIRSLSSVIVENNIKNVALIKINIEGEEYNVLEDLIFHNFISIFNHIQIQFHRGIHNYINRRNIIQNKLLETHKKDYDYEFIWESWSKL